ESYTGDDTVRWSPRATVAGDISYFTYSGRLGFNFRPLTDKLQTGSNPLGSELTLGASAGLRLLATKLGVGPGGLGSTVTTPGSFFKKKTTPLEYLLGAHYLYKEFRFGGGIGGGLTEGFGTPVVRIVLAGEWAPGADKDSDGDGILDSQDACPNVPGIRT